MSSQEEFENIFSVSLHGYSVKRFSENAAWPGQYIEPDTALAWHAWKASREQMKQECIAVLTGYTESFDDAPVGHMAKNYINLIKELE